MFHSFPIRGLNSATRIRYIGVHAPLAVYTYYSRNHSVYSWLQCLFAKYSNMKCSYSTPHLPCKIQFWSHESFFTFEEDNKIDPSMSSDFISTPSSSWIYSGFQSLHWVTLIFLWLSSHLNHTSFSSTPPILLQSWLLIVLIRATNPHPHPQIFFHQHIFLVLSSKIHGQF